MSVNGTNPCEDAEMGDCDGEKVVTMMDVLQEQEDFEEDANAVLGASDDKNCTYSKGHIKRQALYACMTCCPDAKTDPAKRAGVCLACSLMCHENHELVELYTKRNFRCDCGNPKFNSHPCQFTPVKTDLNEENSYNQNFSGIYCICHRPYPDPESTVEEEMIQCIICEDWLHATHLDAVVPSNDHYSEMICKTCMERNEFLHDYSNLAVNVENIDVDVTNNSTEVNETSLCNGVSDAEASTTVNGDIESNKNNEVETKIDDEAEDRADEQNANTNKDTAVDVSTDDSEKSSDKCGTVNKEKNDDDDDQKPVTSEQASEDVTSDDLSDAKNEEQIAETILPNNSEKEANNCLENETDKKDNTADEVPTQIESSESENVAKTEEKNEEGNNQSEKNKVSKESSEETESSEKVVNQEQMEEDLLLADPVEEKETSKDSEAIHQVSTNNEPTTDTNPAAKSEDMYTSESGNVDNNALTENSNKEKSLTETELVPTNNDPKDSSESKEESPSTSSVNVEEKVESLSEADNKDSEETKTEITENVVDKKPEEENNELPTETDVSINAEENNSTNGNIELSDETDKVADTQKRKHSTETGDEESSIKKAKLEETESCVRPKGAKKVHQGATFWPSNFRHKLCTCNECISMYKDLSVLFLTDPEDTVSAYETLGKEKSDGKPASQYEKGLQALSSLDRIQQINALTEYNKMRDKLLDFLKSFKDRREVVKEEDIKAFFAGMKPKREPDGVYFCR